MASKVRTLKPFTSEREFWRCYRSNNKTSRKRRRLLRKRFNKMFPRKHEESLRPLVKFAIRHLASGEKFEEDTRGAFLANVHPEAFPVLLKYGQDYTPHPWRTRPHFGEPTFKACYANAYYLAYRYRKYLEDHPRARDRTPVVYVEGIALGPICDPMLHAWNARGLGSKKATDWTFYSNSHVIRYFGIPLTVEEHKKLRVLTPYGDVIALLFRKETFTPKLKRALIKILEERNSPKR